MNTQVSGPGLYEQQAARQPWDGRRELSRQVGYRSGPDWLGIAVLAGIGLLVAGTIYFGPDLARYMKIRQM
jgi:hypothetical protein